METPTYCTKLMSLADSFLATQHPERACILLGVLHRCAFGAALDEQCAKKCRAFVATANENMPEYSFDHDRQMYMRNLLN